MVNSLFTATNECGLTQIAAKCTVILGGVIIRTPNVISASVSRERGRMVNTASASFFLDASLNVNSGAFFMIKLYETPVFTGIAKRITVGPANRCAGELVVSVSGEDNLYKLENRAFTRRQKLAGLGPLALITGNKKKVELGYDFPPSRYDISNTSSPVEFITTTINFAEQPNFIQNTSSIIGPNHPITKASDPLTNAGASQGGGGGFILHDHTSLSTTGPHSGGSAKAVYSIR